MSLEVKILGPLEKQPWEAFAVAVDFRKLLGGDTIAVADVMVFDTNGWDWPGMVGAVTIRGTLVSAVISGGTEGASFNIRFRVTGTNGEQYEQDVQLNVVEKAFM